MTASQPVDLDLNAAALGSVTDLYQLTMMAGYHGAGLNDSPAVFELFVRRLPANRSYLIFAGLEQAVASVMNLRFGRDQVDDLRTWPVFAAIDPAWFDQLVDFRFAGDLWAVPEGTVVFAGEPLLRVAAPLAQAQLVETLLLAALGYPTLVASKAARIIGAARGRGVIDFGARRGHGLQASFLAARSAFIAGFQGTSQVEAARRLGIPALGTMAHSWVQAFDHEQTAFEEFSRQFPGSTLLVDTYDVLEGVRLAAQVEPPIRAIRIDSGDLVSEASAARTILDQANRRAVEILVSGDLDEFSIDRLVQAEAPIDRFGVGTELITSGGAPSISMVYKLVELAGMGRLKQSPGKRTYPFVKQVDRRSTPEGLIDFDRVIAANEPVEGEALLEPILRGGELIRPWPSLQAIRDRCVDQIARLPESIQSLIPSAQIPIQYSDLLQTEADRLERERATNRRPPGL